MFKEKQNDVYDFKWIRCIKDMLVSVIYNVFRNDSVG